MEIGRVAHVVDWKAPGVDWSVPGGGRGLRGIAFDGERVFVAGSDALFAFSPSFELLAVFRSPFLAQCHDIACFDRKLYLTSTGFDSIIGFDLDDNRFGWGLHITDGSGGLQGTPFDPASTVGPMPANELGLNSLWCDSRGMFISGSRSMGLLHFDARRIVRLVSLPRDVQNARPWRDGVLFNDTQSNVVRFITPGDNRVFQVPKYPENGTDPGPAGNRAAARTGFARGLCVLDESIFASGSSPASITLHNLDTMKTTRSINFSTDIRQSIQSLAVWPFNVPG